MYNMKNIKIAGRATLMIMMSCSVVACSAVDRIGKIGETPDVTPVSNPVEREGYRQVSMPMPPPQSNFRQPNSIWPTGRTTFFKDQRAARVGDIVTVMIDIKDEATLENESERSRTNSENASLDAMLGYEQSLNKVLPEAIDNTNLAQAGSTSRSNGKGTIEREEEVKLKLAAIVTDILPNGNMVISGRQEVRVNFEKRILELAGVIRPEDIAIDNVVSYDKIAEARITYGGEGQMTDVQQPRYGQQLYDIIFPF